jgi:hypothetical protein
MFIECECQTGKSTEKKIHNNAVLRVCQKVYNKYSHLFLPLTAMLNANVCLCLKASPSLLL